MSDDGKGYVLLADSVNRGYQGGSLVGVLGVGPLVAYRLARRGDVNVLRESVIACGKSAGVGIALGGASGIGVSYGKKLPEHEIYYREHRLLHNAGVRRRELYVVYGMSFAASAVAAVSGWRDVQLIAGGAAIGAAAGVLAHVATFKEDSVTAPTGGARAVLAPCGFEIEAAQSDGKEPAQDDMHLLIEP
ncbi:g6546 [Coccomyxa viridis]|uniref:G6546 protein n=1 Tax=Coccomyxa viridis TaxID=1274662 RepID=A0ABP1FVM9_9CHLO